MWSVEPATFWPAFTVAWALFMLFFLPGVFKDTGIDAAWKTVEARARKAVAMSSEDRQHGWTKRNLLGMESYYNFLTNEWSRRPYKCPLYARVIRAGQPDIRLITIVPADLEAPLECLMLTVPFSVWAGVTDFPLRRFFARSPSNLVKLFGNGLQLFHKHQPVGDILSWCWGDPTVTETITVNGYSFEVTTNLAACLRQLRVSGPVTLWVDAICINQKDDEEKQVMIGLMRMLYMSAKTVHCWLGTVQDIYCDRFLSILSNIKRGALSPDLILSISSGEYPVEQMRWDCECLEAVTALPYWSRKWIIQEVVLARQLKVYLGNRNLLVDDPDLLSITLEKLYYHVNLASLDGWAHEQYRSLYANPPTADLRSSFMGMRAGAKLRADYKKVAKLLRGLRFSSVTNPKDAIFGILALLDAYDIKADINATIDEVFLTATTRIMTVTKSLDLLEQARFFGSPSWIPDYSSPVKHTQDHGFEVISKPCFSILGGTLQVAAFELGTIKAVCKGAQNPDRSNAYLPTYSPSWTRKRWDIWQKFFNEHDPDPEHTFQWSFLYQEVGNSKRQGDRRITEQITEAKISETKSEVERFLAGDDSALSGWARYPSSQTIFVTNDNRFGMTFHNADIVAGDLVVAFAGAQVTYIVRPVKQCGDGLAGARYSTLQGHCYLQGVWNERPMRKAARERFGDELRLDQVFEPMILL